MVVILVLTARVHPTRTLSLADALLHLAHLRRLIREQVLRLLRIIDVDVYIQELCGQRVGLHLRLLMAHHMRPLLLFILIAVTRVILLALSKGKHGPRHDLRLLGRSALQRTFTHLVLVLLSILDQLIK